MNFRVIVAGESSMFVLTRQQALKVGDTFGLSGDPNRKLRVRELSYDPVGGDNPEFLIAAERVA